MLKRTFITSVFFLLTTIFLPQRVWAQGANITCGDGRINTAVGCIPFSNMDQLLRWLLPWAFGIAGGIAFLLFIYAGFLIMTSSGDPHRLQAGKELLTAVFSGLLLLVFSVFLLRVIGVNVLGIFPP